ncbi:MAG: cytochrome c [Rhodocyclaceae bacterium]|nr:cytochrome c [Rhodocyclaceae bacterium]
MKAAAILRIPARCRRIALAFALAGLVQGAWAIDLGRGQRLYNLHCASCHGVTGLPVLPDVPSFAMRERLDQPDMMLMRSVKTGKNIMPPFLGLLKDPEIIDVLQYIRTLR